MKFYTSIIFLKNQCTQGFISLERENLSELQLLNKVQKMLAGVFPVFLVWFKTINIFIDLG